MDKRKKSLLIGLTLGDGHIQSQCGYTLLITHSIKQKEYLEYKVKIINELLNDNKNNLYHRKDDLHDEFTYSKNHRYFRIIRNWLYKDGKKRISKNILKYLTPESIAIWFMDDGSHGIERHKITGAIRSHKILLYTYTNLEDTQNIIDYFNDNYGIKFYPIKRKLKDESDAYYLQCRTKVGRKFCDIIRPYVIPSMLYKLINE